jgi:hypothetical protein
MSKSWKKVLSQVGTTRINASVSKNSRGELTFWLSECEFEQGDGYTTETYKLFASWNTYVAREKCPRLTDKVMQSFIDKHLPEAQRIADERAATRGQEVES